MMNTEWYRPKHSHFPVLWCSYKEYIIRDIIVSKDYNRIVNFCMEYVLRDHDVLRYITDVDSVIDAIKNMIHCNISLLCVHKCSDEIVGLNLLYATCKENSNHMDHFNNQINNPHMENIFRSQLLYVTPYHRKKGLDGVFALCRERLMFELNFEIATGVLLPNSAGAVEQSNFDIQDGITKSNR